MMVECHYCGKIVPRTHMVFSFDTDTYACSLNVDCVDAQAAHGDLIFDR